MKQAYKDQEARWALLATQFSGTFEVAGTHKSRSIVLPVAKITVGEWKFFLRDNFYDINLCVVAGKPINISLAEMFYGIMEPCDWVWYMRQIDQGRARLWRGWTNEQIEQPGLLALSNDVPNHQVKTLGHKTRWAKRMEDPSWYNHGSCTITWEGQFGPGAQLWVQVPTYAEGISRIVSEKDLDVYTPGCTSFTSSLTSDDEVKTIIERLLKI